MHAFAPAYLITDADHFCLDSYMRLQFKWERSNKLNFQQSRMSVTIGVSSGIPCKWIRWNMSSGKIFQAMKSVTCVHVPWEKVYN